MTPKTKLVAYRVGIDPRHVVVGDGTKSCALYSREEWESGDNADYEFDDEGRLLFQGQPALSRADRVRLPRWARR